MSAATRSTNWASEIGSTLILKHGGRCRDHDLVPDAAYLRVDRAQYLMTSDDVVDREFQRRCVQSPVNPNTIGMLLTADSLS